MGEEKKELTVEERLERLEDFAAVMTASMEYVSGECRDDVAGLTAVLVLAIHRKLWGMAWIRDIRRKFKRIQEDSNNLN